MSNKLNNFGPIRSIFSPESWIDKEERTLNMGERSARAFCPPDSEGVKICLYYRGRPISQADTTIFRQMIQRCPSMLYVMTEGQSPSDRQVMMLKQLIPVLGTAGHNQLTNEHPEWDKAPFVLEKAEVVAVKGRAGLSVEGKYINPKTDGINQYFYGFFFDGKPSDEASPIYEVFFEAKSPEQFKSFRPEFLKSLESIQWDY